jgi:molybdenum cofactor cytidylyltransferase
VAERARVGGIVLAAGRGSRFGADKRLARLGDGATLLGRVIERLLPAVDELVVVIGATDREADFRARFPRVRVLRAPRSTAGMGCSLADAVAQCGHWEGCLVALADKPFLREATARRVRALLDAHDLVVPVFEGERGHPVGFARHHFRALAALSGDQGARALVERERDRCLFVEIDDPGITADVDTPAQLAGWRALLGE